MRITSGMMTNNMMLNVNRHMRHLDNLWNQYASGKKVNAPSDNPLIAARALKFRSNMITNMDFQSNVQSGLAWMDVTEAAMDNVVRTLLNSARDLANYAANDWASLNDRNTLVNQLNHLLDQIGHEMNQQFAGRYVFSGLRTNMPPVFKRDNDLSFRITQTFGLGDIEQTQSIQIIPPDPANHNVVTPRHNDIHILKLPFRNIDTDATGAPLIDVPGFNVVVRTPRDDDAFTVPGTIPPTVHLIQETGEMVFHVNDVTGAGAITNFPNGQIDITYTKTGFTTGELNPAVYFNSVEILNRFDQLENFPNQTLDALNGHTFERLANGNLLVNPPFEISQILNAGGGVAALAYASPNIDNLTFEPNEIYIGEPAVLTPINLTVGATPPGNRNVLADGEVWLNHNTGRLYMNDATSRRFVNITVTYEKSEFLPTDTIPTANANVSANGPRFEGHIFDMNNQDLVYEFSTLTTVPVNTLAKNVLTANLYSDLRRVIEFIQSIEPLDREALINAFRITNPELNEEELKNKVESHISDQNAAINMVVNNRLNNLLEMADRHATVARREFTDIGSRGNRLELFQNRLEQDEGSLYRLMSNNEDIDMVRLASLIATAQASFMAAMQVGTNIINVTLGNFLQV